MASQPTLHQITVFIFTLTCLVNKHGGLTLEPKELVFKVNFRLGEMCTNTMGLGDM